MDNNQKRFSWYVFFSTFARNLIEVFIGTVLYKAGFSVKEVIFYYLFANFFSLIISKPVVLISKKYSNKLLAVFGIVCLVIVQFMLGTVVQTKLYLLLLAFFYALYRRCYWITRRYYNLKIIRKKDIAKNYSLISIINQVGVIFSAYIGSLLLDYFTIKVLTVISLLIFVISIFYLNRLEFEHEKNNEKIELFKTLKTIPLNDIYIFGSYESLNVVRFLIPIYLYIYIQHSYQTIGILNLISNIATILFAYFYGKKVNNKENYLQISFLLVVVILMIKVNVPAILLFLVSFIEGIVTKMHEISVNKEFYALSKKYEYYNYNLCYEVIQNTFRTVLCIIIYLFVSNLKTAIYVSLIFAITCVFVKFKEVDIDNYKVKE